LGQRPVHLRIKQFFACTVAVGRKPSKVFFFFENKTKQS